VRFEYSQTVAWAVHDGPIREVARIWLDNQVHRDLRPENTGPTGRDVDFAVYKDGSTQAAPPELVEALGTTPVSGFRDTALVVARELSLTRFGNRIPNAEFEVVVDGIDQYPKIALTLPPEAGWDTIASNVSDWRFGPFFASVKNSGQQPKLFYSGDTAAGRTCPAIAARVARCDNHSAAPSVGSGPGQGPVPARPRAAPR
jgi:hypothetical protein